MGTFFTVSMVQTTESRLTVLCDLRFDRIEDKVSRILPVVVIDAEVWHRFYSIIYGDVVPG